MNRMYLGRLKNRWCVIAVRSDLPRQEPRFSPPPTNIFHFIQELSFRRIKNLTAFQDSSNGIYSAGVSICCLCNYNTWPGIVSFQRTSQTNPDTFQIHLNKFICLFWFPSWLVTIFSRAGAWIPNFQFGLICKHNNFSIFFSFNPLIGVYSRYWNKLYFITTFWDNSHNYSLLPAVIDKISIFF